MGLGGELGRDGGHGGQPLWCLQLEQQMVVFVGLPLPNICRGIPRRMALIGSSASPHHRILIATLV